MLGTLTAKPGDLHIERLEVGEFSIISHGIKAAHGWDDEDS